MFFGAPPHRHRAGPIAFTFDWEATANGNIGHFQDNALSTSPQKLEETGGTQVTYATGVNLGPIAFTPN